MSLSQLTEEIFELNPETDFNITMTDLTTEFQMLPILMYRYTKAKAEAYQIYETKKAFLKELRSAVVGKIISEADKRPPEYVINAEVDSTPEVALVVKDMIKAQQDLNTLIGAVDSIKSKKDMLIQLGADARKEVV